MFKILTKHEKKLLKYLEEYYFLLPEYYYKAKYGRGSKILTPMQMLQSITNSSGASKSR